MQKKNGFTLIELMIVVALSGIIMAFVFSAMAGRRGQLDDGSERPSEINEQVN